jgi:predicted RNase H-like nuclease (RuvC/YqgF family)
MKKKVAKEDSKHVTMSAFEKAMVSVANSFDGMDKRFDQQEKAFTLILKQMQTFTEEARDHRQAMSGLMHADVNQERDIEELKNRVNRLEMQIK